MDATLWYFEAIRAYYQATNDTALLHDLPRSCQEIIHWHQQARALQHPPDPADGLLYAGEEGVQPPGWDAKVGRLGSNAAHRQAGRDQRPMVQRSAHHGRYGRHCGPGMALSALAGRTCGRACLLLRRKPVTATMCWMARPDDDAPPPQIQLRPSPPSPHSPPSPLAITKSVVDVRPPASGPPTALRAAWPPPTPITAKAAIVAIEAARRGSPSGRGLSWLIGPFVMAHLRVYNKPGTARSFLQPLVQHPGPWRGSISDIRGRCPFRPAARLPGPGVGVAELLAGLAARRAWQRAAPAARHPESRIIQKAATAGACPSSPWPPLRFALASAACRSLLFLLLLPPFHCL